MSAHPGLCAARLSQARVGVYLLFVLAGLDFAAFASRIPEVKASLDLTAGGLGLTLLAISVGSLAGLPMSGWLVERIGAARSVMLGVLLACTGLMAVSLSVDAAESRPMLTGSLALVGLGVGMWDSSMNIEGAAVERELGRSIMPRLHAAFSAGTVVSALTGAALSRAGLPIWIHLVTVAAATIAAGAWGTNRFLPRVEEYVEAAEIGGSAKVGPMSAWREPRTLLIGFVVLAAAFTEGTANDWLSVAFVEGHDLEPWVGVLGMATFLMFMTIGRILGTSLLDRHGRVTMLRITFVLAVIGAGMVVFGDAVVAFVGAALWGLGASLGFPVGMSAAADDPRRAAARVSVVATIGYLAFLGGPPLLGFLGDHVGVLQSLLAVGCMVALALLCVQVTREERLVDPEAKPALSKGSLAQEGTDFAP